MPGHATEVAPIVDGGASIRVPVLGQGKPVVVVDARPKVQWTEDEVAQAVEEQQRKAGALVALVRAETEATWLEIRRDLNEAAGGQASARVMVMAHHALRAHQALELQTLLAEVEAGKSLAELKVSGSNGQRNQSGLSVIATQALNQAFEAAKSEAKANQGTVTQQLMTRLGHGGARGPDPSPDLGTGGVSSLSLPEGITQTSPVSPLFPFSPNPEEP